MPLRSICEVRISLCLALPAPAARQSSFLSSRLEPWLPLLCQDAYKGALCDLLALGSLVVKRAGPLCLYDALGSRGAEAPLLRALHRGFLWDPKALSKGPDCM
jgi:hypothetical protein